MSIALCHEVEIMALYWQLAGFEEARETMCGGAPRWPC